MNRIDAKFKKLKSMNKKALIGYLTAGDPTLDQTEQLVYALEAGGTDIIELGIPFSDPLADGPVIQEAALRALSQGTTVNDIMSVVVSIRRMTDIPLLFLVYYNTILAYGKYGFISKCSQVGIDGLIIPDLPYEHRHEIMNCCDRSDIALIPLVAPTSKDRVEGIIKGCRGFVYCVSSLGVTGEKSHFYNDIKRYLRHIKEKSTIPIAVGFGISNKEDIEELSEDVDGVIVGSAIVKEINRVKGDTDKVISFVSSLKG